MWWVGAAFKRFPGPSKTAGVQGNPHLIASADGDPAAEEPGSENSWSLHEARLEALAEGRIEKE